MRQAVTAVSLSFIVLLCASSVQAQAQTWSFTGNMNAYRTYHTSTLLTNGTVLVAGGRGIGTYNQNTAEIYNPSTGTFAPTGKLNIGRVYHAAALLQNGEVLIVGGQDIVNTRINCLSSVELYNPSTGKFTVTGSLNTAL